MRELIENVVYENFEMGLHEIYDEIKGTILHYFLIPLEEMSWEERDKWLTEPRLQEVKKLLTTLTDKQLLLCLIAQICEKYR